jgi:hypothetical protein
MPCRLRVYRRRGCFMEIDMTAFRIFATAKPSQPGPLLPMPEHDRRAWELTREKHPQYYRKEKR